MFIFIFSHVPSDNVNVVGRLCKEKDRHRKRLPIHWTDLPPHICPTHVISKEDCTNLLGALVSGNSIRHCCFWLCLCPPAEQQLSCHQTNKQTYERECFCRWTLRTATDTTRSRSLRKFSRPTYLRLLECLDFVLVLSWETVFATKCDLFFGFVGRFSFSFLRDVPSGVISV